MTTEAAIQYFEWLSVKAEKIEADFERGFPGCKSGFLTDKELFDMAISALRAQVAAEKNEPLTQEQISGMHFEKIWLDYGEDDDGEDNGGEWAVVLFGKIYSIETLEGAGFEEMLFDLMDGETLDHPSGQYTVHRRKPKEGTV